MTLSGQRNAGFTLIELMIAVTILGIIVAVAYPSYQDYVFDSRRTDGQAALMDAAQRLERCYTSSVAYNGGACIAVVTAIGNENSPEAYYALSTSNMGATTYTLTATPRGAQANDECGNLTLNQAGAKDINNADNGVDKDDCW